ncbi:MAG: hypothetical protein F6K30_02395, partial [Cyanothece sp. SIO2G6]|nr:hypothetical protein [Cyanothece sp. SIO2G6]
MIKSVRHLFWMLSLLSAVAIVLLTVVIQPLVAQDNVPGTVSIDDIRSRLPLALPHALPASLISWSGSDESHNYFDQVQPTTFGYLVWSQFPVQVYLDTQPIAQETPEHIQVVEHWLTAVQTAIDEWSAYIPLVRTSSPDDADIVIVAQAPPLRWSRKDTSGLSQTTSWKHRLGDKFHNLASSQLAIVARFRGL